MNKLYYPEEIPAYFGNDHEREKLVQWEATTAFCSSLDVYASLDRGLTFIQNYLPASMLVAVFWRKNNTQAEGVCAGDSTNKLRYITKISHISPERKKVLFADHRHFIRIADDTVRLDLVDFLSPLIHHEQFSFISFRVILEEGQTIANLIVASPGRDQYSLRDASFFFTLHHPVSILFSNVLEYMKLVEDNSRLQQSNVALRQQLSAEILPYSELPGMQQVSQQILTVAPLESPVLILGETGVGKEYVADALYAQSRRQASPFIKVNCGALPESLIDSALFGHEKGAFTGAEQRNVGRLERAHKGTLMLDEIGELPFGVQARLLRFLQNGEIERVGGKETLFLDVRIIAATNADLLRCIKEKTFREDLYYRLNVFPIHVPPLRQRREDIGILAKLFLRKIATLSQTECPNLSNSDLARLRAYDWPGNIRELRNTIERSFVHWSLNKSKPFVIRMDENPARTETDPTAEAPPFPRLASFSETATFSHPMAAPGTAAFPSLDECVAAHIQAALSRTHGRINGPNGAAALLKINPNTLRGKLNKLGIPYGVGKGFD